MATKGSVKRLSVDHEEYVASKYSGRRSPSSGGADNDNGDVRSKHNLIECKLTGSPGRPQRTTLLTQFEKVAAEAYLEGRSPVIALRYYWPDSFLAGPDGWVDLAVRLLEEDAFRDAEVS
jgi:hypothetical protein